MSNDFLGLDRSGNDNNWTVNNMTLAADQVVDSPTNNFCTLNPLDIASDTLKEGNLKTTGGQDNTWNKKIGSTMSTSTTKIYFEVYQWRENAEGGGTGGMIGISPVSVSLSSKNYNDAGAHYSIEEGVYYYNGGTSTSGQTTGQADVIGMCAYDPNTGKVWFGVNGTWNGSGNPATGANPAVTLTASDKEMSPFLQPYNTGFVANFGQDSSFAAYKTAQGNQDGNDIGDFYYTPPTGFLALCTKNLPDVAVTPSEHFNTVLYTGNGGTQNITGVGFQPDWVWFKTRSFQDNHTLYDSVRGATKDLRADVTNAENTNATGLSAFNTDGFTVGGMNNTNKNAETYVAWNWKANGSGSSNSNGSITSTVSANVDAGFSIVSYVGNTTAGATVGHGLSSAPEMIIIKNRDRAYDWIAWHEALADDHHLRLNGTHAAINSSTRFNSTDPSSTVFTLGSQDDTNGVSGANDDLIAYCFHSVDGYSKVGSHKGNGSTDGTFVYTGFRPMFVMTKVTSDAHHWTIYNTDKATYNHDATTAIYANDSSAEGTGAAGTRRIDLVSNGFKLRHNSYDGNANGENYIYIAFAETPFKYSNAR